MDQAIKKATAHVKFSIGQRCYQSRLLDNGVMKCNEVMTMDRWYQQGNRISQRLFSALNLSHASFRVPNTDPAIIRCSVVAVVEIYRER